MLGYSVPCLTCLFIDQSGATWHNFHRSLFQSPQEKWSPCLWERTPFNWPTLNAPLTVTLHLHKQSAMWAQWAVSPLFFFYVCALNFGIQTFVPTTQMQQKHHLDAQNTMQKSFFLDTTPQIISAWKENIGRHQKKCQCGLLCINAWLHTCRVNMHTQ